MATKAELIESLNKRLSGVPNLGENDVENWLEFSMMKHGYSVSDEEINDSDVLLVLLYAEYDASVQIALRAASYFNYKDAEESVDKRQVSEQYRRLAAELKTRYNEEKANRANEDGSSVFGIMTRADRT